MKKSFLFRSLIMTLVVMSVICLIWHPLYYVNDDFIIRDIFSGRFSGVPDAHVYNVIYPAAFVLSRLYSAFPGIDFWGILIWILPFVCLFILLNSTMCAVPDHPVLSAAAVLSVFSVTALFCSVFFTFTMSGAMCAATGMYRLIIIKEPQKLRNFPVSLILFLIAFCIRKDTLFMVVPFCAVYFLIEFIRKRSLKYILRIMLNVLLLLVCMSSLWIVHTRAFSDGNWSSYMEFRSLRKAIHDFSQYPDYSENTEFYEELGLSYEEYAVVGNTGRGGVNTALDISPDIRTVLSSVVAYNDSVSANKGLSEILSRGCAEFIDTFLFFDSYFPIHILILIPLIAFAVFISGNKALARIRIVSALLVSAAEITALSCKGRITFAVLYSIIAVTCLYILAVSISGLNEKISGMEDPASVSAITAGRKRIKLTALIIAFIMILIPELYFIDFRSSDFSEREITGWKIDKYVNEHPDAIFFEPAVFLTTKTYPLTDFSGSFDRTITLGGWNYSSPEYEQAVRSAGIDNINEIESTIVNNDNAYIISSMEYMKNIVNYLEWKYGHDLKYEKAGVVYGKGKVYCWDFSPE